MEREAILIRGKKNKIVLQGNTELYTECVSDATETRNKQRANAVGKLITWNTGEPN